MTARDVRDRLGEALRRLNWGLLRPLWANMSEDHRESWRKQADALARLLREVGLKITVEDEDAPDT